MKRDHELKNSMVLKDFWKYKEGKYPTLHNKESNKRGQVNSGLLKQDKE